MKKEYDFSKGKRGAVDPAPAGKKRITIRLDNEIIDWFRNQAETRGGGNYQTMINSALNECIKNRGESLEETLGRVVREEFRKFTFQFNPQMHLK
jgi:hypothetical protein